ncbi:MAG TPA: dihydroneopterin aldolase [Fimbriimonas sp.]|nr:dihydroneopterin aldolase [Fimbriimonas sp.]
MGRSEARLVVFVSGLEFHAYHGVTPEEQAVGHRFRLSLRATVDDPPAGDDSLENSVDYAEMARLAVNQLTSFVFNTVEHACEQAASVILHAFPRISSLEIRLSKLHPALEMSIEEVGVERIFVP